jgi:outer membrane protein
MYRLIAAFFLLLTAMPSWALEIAVVDFQRAGMETTEGKAARDQLDSMYATRKAEIERMQVELEAEFADYQVRATILSDAAKAETEQKLMEKQSRFEQTYMQYQQEMQQQYVELVQNLEVKMREMAGVLAKEKGVDLVLDSNLSIYVGPGVSDLTDALVTRYNGQ